MHNPSHPLASVVIPNFNGEAWVLNAIEAAAAQTYEPIEIIVVDDGSRDGSVNKISAYKAAHPEVLLRIIPQENGGVSAARNRGIEEAKGDIIALLDADDLWHPHKIARQMEEVLRAPTEMRGRIVCVASVLRHTLDASRTIIKTEPLFYHPSTLERKWVAAYPSTWLVPRALFDDDKVGKFDTSLSVLEDHDWQVRASAYGAITKCPMQNENEEPLVTYFLNPQATYKGFEKMAEGLFVFIKRHQQWLCANAPEEFATFLTRAKADALRREGLPIKEIVQRIDEALARVNNRGALSPEHAPTRETLLATSPINAFAPASYKCS